MITESAQEAPLLRGSGRIDEDADFKTTAQTDPYVAD